MTVKKILVIDDEEGFCRGIKKTLETRKSFIDRFLRRGGNQAPYEFQVLMAHNGDTGIQMAKQEKPDCILLDIVMPGMSGAEVAEELLSYPSTASIPIIFVTSIIKDDETGDMGGRIFVAKPVVIEDLVRKIHSVLS